jgi:hypothetical protein
VTDDNHRRRSYLAPLSAAARRALVDQVRPSAADDGATELDDSDLRDFNREGDHYHGIHGVAAFQHDWRSNDALFFAHHNRVRGDDGVSGGRSVLGLPHDGQSHLWHVVDESSRLRVPRSTSGVPSERQLAVVQDGVLQRSRAVHLQHGDLDDAKRRHPASQTPRDGLPDAS